MSDIYVYLKSGDDKQSLIDFMNNLTDGCYDNCYSFSENKRSNVLYRKIQQTLVAGDVLALTSIDTFGVDKQVVFDELTWLKRHHVLLVIQNYPSTHTLDAGQNLTAISAFLDMYENILGVVKTTSITKKLRGGRRTIQYPDNWDELYEKWICKEITATEFIAKSGLKKGTFYTMLNEYKQMLAANEAELSDANIS